MKEQEVQSILEHYEKPLIRFAFFMTGDEELAKDFVQDTFIKLIQQKESPINLGAWLYRVCRNLIIDFKRREKKVLFLENYEEVAPITDTKELDNSETFNKLERVLQKLPAIEKEVVLLKYYELKSYKEISLITGKSITNVGFILHQAIKRMKVEMKKEER